MNNNDFDEKKEKEDDEEGGSTSTGTTGASGSTGYHYLDPSSQQQRDDLRSPSDNRRLLASHPVIHKDRVTKQKMMRQERELQKEGKLDLVSSIIHQSKGTKAGAANLLNNVMEHPYAKKFRGKQDEKVNHFPNGKIPDTNTKEYQARLELSLRQEKKNENTLRNTLRNTPTFRR